MQLSTIWNSHLINFSFFLLKHLKYNFVAHALDYYLVEWTGHSHLFMQFTGLYLVLLASLPCFTGQRKTR